MPRVTCMGASSSLKKPSLLAARGPLLALQRYSSWACRLIL